MLRLLVGARFVLGSLLLATPAQILGPVSHRRIGAGEQAVARLLGARNLIEAAVVARRRSRGWLLAGAAVDSTHAVSMITLAAVRPDRRRLATASALAAAVTATAGIVAARDAGQHPSVWGR